MAKKIKNQNPPRRVEIRGQDHLLAYITPAEAQLLMDNGGSGEPGPMGIPSFVKAGAGAGGPAGMGSKSMEGFGGGGRDRDGPDRPDVAQQKQTSAAETAKAAAEKAAQQAAAAAIAEKAVAKDYGTTAPTKADIEQMRGFGFDTDAARAAEKQLMVGGTPSGFENKMALEQIDRRLAQAGSNYGIPGPFGSLLGTIGAYNLKNIRNTIMSGGTPMFDEFGKLQGAFGPGLLGGMAYSGMPIQGNELTGWRDPMAGGERGEIVQASYNPSTGQQDQCPEGYVFDEDLQACRVSAELPTYGGVVGGDGFTYEPGTYARMGLLDVAPTGLPEFAGQYGTGFGTPQDFEAANLAYRRRAGTMGGIFQDPYNLQGYTLLS